MRSRLRSISLVATCGCALVMAIQAPAEEPAAAPDARGILLEMAQHLANLPQFSVNVRSGYDVVQDSGQKIEFNERRRLMVKRPDGLRVEVEHSNGERQTVVFDGTRISVLSDPLNVYAQAEKTGTIDDAVTYFVRDLKMRMPLAMMLMSRLPAEVERRAESVDYVEETSILGKPAHHLAARTESVDFQVWIAKGAEPLPLRIVLTYKTSDALPQFWGEFSDWNLAPAADATTFAFAPPAGANRIPFLTEVQAIAAPEAAK